MDTGTKISAIAHVTLIGWALFGGTFRSEPLPMAVQDVSVISAEQFAAMTAQRNAPEVPTPSSLQQPEEPQENAATPEPVEEEQPTSEVSEAVEPEPDPEPEAVEPPPAPVEVEQPPALDPPPDTEIAALPVPPGPEAQPRPADKVAPEPVAPPPPEAAPDDIETPAVSLDEGAEIQQEQQDQTAPEEATDEIVTEAEEAEEYAPWSSPRPQVRPNRPTPPAQPDVAETAEPETPAADESAIQDALAEALGQGSEPSGPPLTSGEKDAMRLAVSRCWNVGSLSTDALQTVVVVAFSLTPDGKVVGGSLRMIDSSGGSAGSASQAYEAARRAILRCGAKGYDLPADKYAQWQDIEITFNPERMRIK